MTAGALCGPKDATSTYEPVVQTLNVDGRVVGLVLIQHGQFVECRSTRYRSLCSIYLQTRHPQRYDYVAVVHGQQLAGSSFTGTRLD